MQTATTKTSFVFLQQTNLATSIFEIIPFAKEMLNQGCRKCLLKLNMLGLVGGLVETLLIFVEHQSVEEAPAELIMEKQHVWNTSLVHPEVVDP